VGQLDDLPSVAKTVTQLGAVGALIVISLWLVYTQSSAMDETRSYRDEIRREFAAAESRHMVHMDRSSIRHRDIVAMLRLICTHMSETSAERSACLSTPFSADSQVRD